MKRAIILAATATAICSLTACGGSSPAAPAPPADIAGPYNASVTASSACSANLPSAMRVINYPVEVSQTGATAQVKITPHGGTPITVAATLSGQTVTFPSLSFSGTTAAGTISVAATAGKATVASNGEITGTLSGTFQAGAGASCNAGDHLLQMKRCVVTCSGGICMCS